MHSHERLLLIVIFSRRKSKWHYQFTVISVTFNLVPLEPSAHWHEVPHGSTHRRRSWLYVHVLEAQSSDRCPVSSASLGNLHPRTCTRSLGCRAWTSEACPHRVTPNAGSSPLSAQQRSLNHSITEHRIQCITSAAETNVADTHTTWQLDAKHHTSFAC